MDFSSAKFQLGMPAVAKAEALGQPGQRKFRLLLQTPDIAATLWIEKEQLSELAKVLSQLAEEMERGSVSEPIPAARIPKADRFLDFTVGHIEVGEDSERQAVVIIAHDIEDDEDDAPMVSFWLSRTKADTLGKEAIKVVQAGRARCPLCGAAMDPAGHVCARMNGHSKTELPK